MMRNKQSLFLLLAMTVFPLLGCGQKDESAVSDSGQTENDPKATTSTNGDAQPDTITASADTNKRAEGNDGTKTATTSADDSKEVASVTKTAGTPAKSAEIPKTADAAVLAALRGITEDRPQSFWEFLPASYQKDINDLIHLTAEKSDKEIWNETFAVLKKSVGILKSKKEIILGILGKNAPPDTNPEDLSKGWDQVVDLINTIVTSDFSDLDKMKKLDLGVFLSSTGSSMIKQIKALVKLAPVPVDPFEMIQKVTTKVIKTEGEVVTVQISAPDEEPKEKEFVQVEGKWIPKEMADEWADNIAEAKEKLESAPEQSEKMKPQILGMLKGLNVSLDQLAAAETEQELQIAGQQLFGALMGSMMMLAPQGPPSDLPETTDSPDAKKPESKGKEKPKEKKDSDGTKKKSSGDKKVDAKKSADKKE